MFERIKAFLSDERIFFCLLLLLVGLASFGLGRASVSPNTLGQPAGIVFSQSPATAEEVDVPSPESNSDLTNKSRYVASKNGSKYHFPWCPGAKQMKEENKVWFDSVEAAKAAGYTPAANCPGL